jgi:hypothetical protein
MFEQRAERSSSEPFAQGTDNAAGNENVFHGSRKMMVLLLLQ